MVTILPDPIQLVSVITNVHISSSIFVRGNYSRAIIQSYNGGNILQKISSFWKIRYCQDISSSSQYGKLRHHYTQMRFFCRVNLCTSRNMTTSNNTMVDNQTKTEQYYTFDQIPVRTIEIQ
jgi:hypothetical protein